MPYTAQGQPQTPDKRHCFRFQVVYASLFVEKEQRHFWNLHCRVFASVQLLGKGNPATLLSHHLEDQAVKPVMIQSLSQSCFPG